MALTVQGHYVLFAKELADKVAEFNDFKSSTVRATVEQRWNTISKLHKTSLFSATRSYSQSTLIAFVMYYDVRRRTPDSIRKDTMCLRFEGFDKEPSADEFITEWLPDAEASSDTYTRIDPDTKAETTMVVYSARFKAFDPKVPLPKNVADLPSLWKREKRDKEDTLCVCCGFKAQYHCDRCNRACHPITCATRTGEMEAAVCVCKLCTWVEVAVVELEKQKPVKPPASAALPALSHSNSEDVDSERVKWLNVLNTKGSPMAHHPKITVTPSGHPKQLSFKGGVMLCWNAVRKGDDLQVVFEGQAVPKQESGHVVAVIAPRVKGDVRPYDLHVLTVTSDEEKVKVWIFPFNVFCLYLSQQTTTRASERVNRNLPCHQPYERKQSSVGR